MMALLVPFDLQEAKCGSDCYIYLQLASWGASAHYEAQFLSR